MIGKINKKGNLEIKRNGVMKEQFCPYSSKIYEGIPCGDCCPLFGEPISDTIIMWLSLCKNVLEFEAFVDERVQP